MDGSRFDRIARALASGTTRRRTLQGLAGGLFAGLLGHAGLEDAAAGCVKPGKKGCKGPRNRKCCKDARCQGGTKRKAGRCVCKGDLTKCGTKCVNTQTNDQHCGGCNQPCGGTTPTCRQGICECPGGLTLCGTECVDTETDKEHCDGCNNSCGEGHTCEQGICVCPAPRTQCGTACVDTQTDNRHCGGCDQPCGGTTPTCRQGACATELGCRAGGTICNDPSFPNCPGTTNTRCYCITDVEGTPRCADFDSANCPGCTSNADCGPNWVCFNAIGCGCPGNGCVRATCGGVT